MATNVAAALKPSAPPPMAVVEDGAQVSSGWQVVNSDARSARDAKGGKAAERARLDLTFDASLAYMDARMSKLFDASRVAAPQAAFEPPAHAGLTGSAPHSLASSASLPPGTGLDNEVLKSRVDRLWRDLQAKLDDVKATTVRDAGAEYDRMLSTLNEALSMFIIDNKVVRLRPAACATRRAQTCPHLICKLPLLLSPPCSQLLSWTRA
ncbi:hypothetical protein EON62_03330 [archaeon]|nr:MAG: hypothetical protein EON62_03330 [archaeon]